MLLLFPLLIAAASPPPSTLAPAPEPGAPSTVALADVSGPRPASSGRGPLFDFDILTDQDAYEANVSDPNSPSSTVRVIVKNNSTALIPIYVQLSVSINLGAQASIEPSRVGPILYQGTSTALVTVFLPEDTLTSLVANLRINGTCENNNQQDFKQVLLTVRQWHSLRLQNVTLSSSSPVERELVQISAKVRNLGNGPAFCVVGAFIDGQRLRARVDGGEVDQNTTIKVEPQRFVLLTATWKASYGHHNFLLQAEDVGAQGGNDSSAITRDSRMVSFFVSVNLRDWTPYFILTGFILVAVCVAVFRYRKRLAARFPRFGRIMRIRLPPPATAIPGRMKDGVKRAAARVGQRPGPKYISKRVRSDIDRLRERARKKGPGPDTPLEPVEMEKGRPGSRV